jgi:GNAT superfamily N-acetyltransferase
MPSVHLRPATEHDVGFLTDVVVVATSADNRMPEGLDEHHWRRDVARRTAEHLEGELEDRAAARDGATTYVIEIAGERAGRMRVVRSPDVIELLEIHLLPAHQGHGIGTHLIEQLVVEAHGAGLPARVRVETDNPRGRSLCERLGFGAVDGADETVLEAPPPA